ELTLAAIFSKSFQRPLVRFRSSIGDHVFGEELARVRRRPGGNRLRGGSSFSRHIAGRKRAVFDRKQGLPVGSIEQEYISLLGGLGDRVHLLAIAANRNQHGRGREVAIPKIVSDPLKMPDSLSRFRVKGE